MVKRMIDTSFWEDEKVIDLFSPEDKYFMLYILSNPRHASIGIYKFPKKKVAFEMGYTVDSVNVLLDRFENKYNLIRFDSDTQEIAVLNSLKYNIAKGGTPIEKMIEREINKVTSSTLILASYERMLPVWELSDRAIDLSIKEMFEKELVKRKVPKENINTNTYTNTYTNTNTNTDSETDSLGDSQSDSQSDSQKEKIPYKEIIDYLNEKTDKAYRSTSSQNKKLIKARWNEGYQLDDFKTVIDNKLADWTGTEWERFLQPSTLFGPKFDKYLNERPQQSMELSTEEFLRARYADDPDYKPF